MKSEDRRNRCRATLAILAASLALILTGCIMSEYEDVSSLAPYSSVVGHRLEAKSQLYIHAVTLDANYAKRVDLYSITEPPGFSGPELIYRDALPAGTAFRVLGVRRCTNCLFSEGVEMLVQPLDTDKYREAPAEIYYGLLESGAVFVSDEGT